MKNINNFLELFGLNITLLFGGAIGAFIGRNKKKSFWQQIISVFTSAFIANYTAPLVIALFGLSPETTAGLGFIIGYMGLGMLDFTIDKFKEKINKTLIDEDIEK